MSKSGAEKIQFILNNHEQAYRRLKPVYTFLELASWISVVLLIIYLSGKNHVLTAAFLCFAWTAFWVLFLLHYFPKVFFILDRQSLLNLMEATKDSPDVKQELLNRLFSRKRMTGRDEMDICRLLRKNEEEKIRQSELNIIRNFIDEQQLTNSDIPKKSTVPNEDKKGIR
ncbi:TPA: hypothetical protein J4Q69_001742 [Escherichia coli]|uniref:Protein YafA n=5 Tax=Enterobacteriaceae TaxID=543 RepID=A0A2S1PPC4_ECOLX|nr:MULTISPECIES: hypothetical protein [Enterobacteriaceae]EAA5276316.1 hypothetical protein [Salmonella enterica subsp. enterica serovar Chester]EBF9674428.1 hypothetical protein [Salmonella enterica subsp. enterica serovar Newport]EBW2994522.1 hypothetical protein [Salmonella enterica subsp. enterica serovar Oslo]EBY4579205.1 hypothetical protein [Salmonella enterica subsp. enterica serovar Typhimurium]EBY7424741.1 hypothetical protein [Salmonella enterica subsp. enterica serovar Enteritidis]